MVNVWGTLVSQVSLSPSLSTSLSKIPCLTTVIANDLSCLVPRQGCRHGMKIFLGKLLHHSKQIHFAWTELQHLTWHPYPPSLLGLQLKHGYLVMLKGSFHLMILLMESRVNLLNCEGISVGPLTGLDIRSVPTLLSLPLATSKMLYWPIVTVHQQNQPMSPCLLAAACWAGWNNQLRPFCGFLWPLALMSKL